MRAANPSFRGPAMLGLLALAVLVLGFGYWLVTANLSGAVITRGQVELDQGHLPIQHIDGGTVAVLRVTEGAGVAAGEVLIVLDGAALRAELAVTELRINEILARRARLLAERDGLDAPDFPVALLTGAVAAPDLAAQIEGQRTLFAARRATLDEMHAQLAQRIVRIRAELEGLSAQQQALAEQSQLVDQELQAQETLLAGGLVAQAVVLAQRRERARLRGQLAALQAETAATEGQIVEIGLQGTELATRRREEAATELREIEPTLLELQTRHAVLRERIARLEIRAPVAGTVMGLANVATGAVLRAAEPAMNLVPANRPLVVAAEIAALHVDQVAPGQRADLAFPALASRDAPRLAGRVTLVSADALRDPQTGAAHYRVRIEIDPDERARLGGLVLVPGMPVDVFLATGARRPLNYLLEPFTTYFSRAMRES